MSRLVCDLGGTNCRLALWDEKAGRLSGAASFRNAEFESFPDVAARYLARRGVDAVDRAAIALAAPCESDNIALTNHGWTLSKAEIAAATGAKEVRFINDLEAMALAVRSAPDLLVETITEPAQRGLNPTKLVVNAGTGFNCAAVTASGATVACEVGHTTFAPITGFDHRFQTRATERFGRCSIERLLSGTGLEAIDALLSGDDVAPRRSSHDIIRKGLAGTDETARRACLELTRILGAVAGDLALTFMAEGGVYLAGGVARAVAPLLVGPDSPFHAAFADKGRMTGQMARFPILLIRDDSAGLLGCVASLSPPVPGGPS